LDDQSFLESDSDEQLLLTIPFMQHVKIHSLLIRAPADKGPKSIKIFLNKPNLDFSDAESLAATQSFELKESDFNKKLPLVYAKFQNVFSLTIFVKNNLSNSDVTTVEYLAFFWECSS